MFVDIAVIYCITSLCEQTCLSNYCIISRTPTVLSPSPIHSRNIAIEAAATNAEFTVLHTPVSCCAGLTYSGLTCCHREMRMDR